MEQNNHAEWSNDRLSERMTQLAEINQPWQGSRERLRQIQDEMSVIGFEMSERYRESTGKEWNE